MLDRDKEAACKVVSKLTRTIKKPELLKDTREGFDHWAGPPVVAKGDTEPKNVKNAEHDCSKTHPDMTHEMWTEVEKKKKQEKKADDADTMKALAILAAIGGGGGAGIGGIANALSGDSVGRGMLTGGLTGLGATAGLYPGLMGAAYGGDKLEEAGLNPLADSHMGAILGVGAGGALGAGAGGLGGYQLAQALQRDEEEEKMGSAQRCLELGRGSSLTKSAAPPAGASAGTGGFLSNIGKSIGDAGRSVGSSLGAAGRGAMAGLKSAPWAGAVGAAAGGMQGWNMARQRQATNAANQVTPAQTRAAANRDSQRPTPPVTSGAASSPYGPAMLRDRKPPAPSPPAASSPYGPAGVGWNLKQDERRVLEGNAPAGQSPDHLDQYNDKTPTPQPPAPATVPFGTAQVAKVNTDTTPRQSIKAIELPPMSTSVFDQVDPNSQPGRDLAPSTTADDALRDQTQRQLRRRRSAGGGVSSAMEAGRTRPSNSNLPNDVSGPLNAATRRSSSPGQPSQALINPTASTTTGGGIDTAGLDAGVNRSMDKYNTPPAGNFGDIPEGADISAEVPGVQAGTGSRDERSVTHGSNLGRAGTPEFRRGKRGASAMQLAKAGATSAQLGNWKPTAASQVPFTGKKQKPYVPQTKPVKAPSQPTRTSRRRSRRYQAPPVDRFRNTMLQTTGQKPPATRTAPNPSAPGNANYYPGAERSAFPRVQRVYNHRAEDAKLYGDSADQSDARRAQQAQFSTGKRGASAMQLAEPGSSTRSVRAANRRNARLLEEEGKLKRRKKKSRKSKKKKTDYKGVDSKMASIQYNGDLLKYANALLAKQAATAYSSARRPSNLRRGLPKRRPSSTTPPEQQSGSDRRANFLSGATGLQAQTRQEKRDAQTAWQMQNSKRKRDRRTHGAISNSASELVGQGYSTRDAMRMAQDQHAGGVDPSPGRSDSRLNSSTRGAIARNEEQMSGASPRRKRELQSRNRRLQGHIDRRADRAQQAPAERAMAQGRPAPADPGGGMVNPPPTGDLPDAYDQEMYELNRPGNQAAFPDYRSGSALKPEIQEGFPSEWFGGPGKEKATTTPPAKPLVDAAGGEKFEAGSEELRQNPAQTPPAKPQTPAKQTPAKPPVKPPVSNDPRAHMTGAELDAHNNPGLGFGYDPSFADPNVQQPLSDDQFLAQHGNTPLGALTAEQRKRRTDIAAGRQSSRRGHQQNQANERRRAADAVREKNLRDIASSWPSAQVTATPTGSGWNPFVSGPSDRKFTVGVDSPRHPQHSLYQKAVGWADQGKDPRRVFLPQSTPGPGLGQSFGPSRYEHPYSKAYQGYMQQHGKDNKFRYQDIEGYQKPKPRTMTGAPLNLNEPGSVGGPRPAARPAPRSAPRPGSGSVTRTTPDF